jgi:hypothetical protein
MCHDLSNKINAKISRQRLDLRFGQLAELLTQAGKPSQDSVKEE